MKAQPKVLILAIGYALAGWLGNVLWQYSYDSPGFMWLNSGIGVLLFLSALEYRKSLIFIGALTVNLLHLMQQSLVPLEAAVLSLILAAADFGLVFSAGAFYRRLSKGIGHPLFSMSDDIARYFLIVCLLPPAIFVGAKSIILHLFLPPLSMLDMFWATLGEMVSLLMLGPLLFWKGQQKDNPVALPSILTSALILTFPVVASLFTHVSLLFLAFPLALIMAIRMGFSGALFSGLVLAVVTLASFIFSPEHTPFLSLADIWIFLLSFCLTSHFIAQAVIELKRNKESLQRLVEKRTEALRETNQQLELLATTDELTGAVNRRHFLQLTRYAINAANRYDEPIALLALDIDHFKKINDNYGHDVGDRALKHFAAICQASLRTSDTFARIGGEEFLILLPRTRFLAAKLVAEKICQKVASTPLITNQQSNINITVSIGVAQWQDNEDFKLTMKRADEALYGAKSAGRNQVKAPTAALVDA